MSDVGSVFSLRNTHIKERNDQTIPLHDREGDASQPAIRKLTHGALASWHETQLFTNSLMSAAFLSNKNKKQAGYRGRGDL